VVEQVVKETAADFDGAPVKDFVPVLTERRARVVLGAKGLKRRWEHLMPKRSPSTRGS